MQCLLIAILLLVSQVQSSRPNIVFILADDLGWNDVGFHGSSDISTPNIDALAYSGTILHRYYVTPICTPSRSALMTGKYPIRTGMQHRVLYGAEPRGLPLQEKLLPEYLKELGYMNHIVGKWHLGHYKKEYTPLYRGFHSHLGYWTGHLDYNDHTAMETNFWGLDFRRNMDVAWDLHGHYSTDVFTQEAVKIIDEHNTSKPLFLYVAHAAVHSANPYNPLPAPDDVVAKFANISDYNRQRFAGILSKLDESVGQIVHSLQNKQMLKNTIIVFSTDNGGPAAGFNLNAASNWPLKGVKNTYWEGGVRGSGFIWSSHLKRSKVFKGFMHICDWMPTLISAAGGDLQKLENIDGINLWPAMSKDDFSNNRTEILHNIDDILNVSSLTHQNWKIVKGTTYEGTWDSWYGPSGRNLSYNIPLVQNSLSGKALQILKMAANVTTIIQLRNEVDVKCGSSVSQQKSPSCKPLEAPCLFDIENDPCEFENLADKYPEIVHKLEDKIRFWNSTALPPGNLPLDPRGNPKFWDYTWTNFGDYEFDIRQI